MQEAISSCAQRLETLVLAGNGLSRATPVMVKLFNLNIRGYTMNSIYFPNTSVALFRDRVSWGSWRLSFLVRRV